MFDSSRFLAQLTSMPGVYQMFDSRSKLLYVGKAKNLKNRVASYFSGSDKSLKTRSLVVKIADIQVTVTASETEALLLEQSLIKSNRPPYNILLRDDKSYPYIYVSTDHAYPQVTMRRGKKSSKGRLFGPYTSSLAVRDSLNYLQKVLNVRQCDDTFFSHRARPCLQYQIKRCKAPCVGYVSLEEYRRDVDDTISVLDGRESQVLVKLQRQMSTFAERLEYEKAAETRDKISALRHLQERQHVDAQRGDCDVLAIAMRAGSACVQVLSVRGGTVQGSDSWFPKLGILDTEEEVLCEFVAQYYLNDRPGRSSIVVTNVNIQSDSISNAYKTLTGKRLEVLDSVKGDRKRWLDLAARSALENLQQRLQNKRVFHAKIQSLQDKLGLSSLKRIECFDISHSSGEATVASCVVYDDQGPSRKDFRAYNITDITGGDDYAAMRQALQKRYEKAVAEKRQLPELLLIDGGKGQMKQALDVLNELSIVGVLVVGVAKGPTRKAGLETLYIGQDYRELQLLPHEVAFHLIQQVRDDAHNHAVRHHRKRRDKSRVTSSLEGIEGIGQAKRQALLQYFGGLQQIEKASLEDLMKVKGISNNLAKKVFEYFHQD